MNDRQFFSGKVAELQATNKSLRAELVSRLDMISDLMDLQTALRFYAKADHYADKPVGLHLTSIEMDEGETARKALHKIGAWA